MFSKPYHRLNNIVYYYDQYILNFNCRLIQHAAFTHSSERYRVLFWRVIRKTDVRCGFAVTLFVMKNRRMYIYVCAYYTLRYFALSDYVYAYPLWTIIIIIITHVQLKKRGPETRFFIFIIITIQFNCSCAHK